ncbi:hypothetical protein [Primorskyibacter sp. S87]|uniref:hypothetical protein n=1 Tax=Primorskyibacter sp. S87 TaxID=3415126 RepID=UPI003C7E0690
MMLPPGIYPPEHPALAAARKAEETGDRKDLERAADLASEALYGGMDAVEILHRLTGYYRFDNGLVALPLEMETLHSALADITEGIDQEDAA